MKITIKEIAAIAGVHRATVDKVLHHREGVSDEVRSKVQRIIDEAGYKPNPLGKALKHANKKVVIAAVLVKVDALTELRKGIEKAYDDYKKFNMEIQYHMVDYPQAEKQAEILSGLNPENCAGVVVSPLSHPAVEAALKKLKDAAIPVVTLNIDCTDKENRLCFVGQDMEKAGWTAARMADILLGSKGQVAILGSNSHLFSVAEREKGFRHYMRENAPHISVLPSIETNEDPALTFQKTTELLQKAPPDLLFVTGGSAAEAARALQNLPPVPQRPFFICFERYPAIESLLHNSIITCTISSDLTTQGYEAIKQLFEFIVFNRRPTHGSFYMPIGIILRENL